MLVSDATLMEFAIIEVDAATEGAHDWFNASVDLATRPGLMAALVAAAYDAEMGYAAPGAKDAGDCVEYEREIDPEVQVMLDDEAAWEAHNAERYGESAGYEAPLTPECDAEYQRASMLRRCVSLRKYAVPVETVCYVSGGLTGLGEWEEEEFTFTVTVKRDKYETGEYVRDSYGNPDPLDYDGWAEVAGDAYEAAQFRAELDDAWNDGLFDAEGNCTCASCKF